MANSYSRPGVNEFLLLLVTALPLHKEHHCQTANGETAEVNEGIFQLLKTIKCYLTRNVIFWWLAQCIILYWFPSRKTLTTNHSEIQGVCPFLCDFLAALKWTVLVFVLFCFYWLLGGGLRWGLKLLSGEPRSNSKPSLAREHASCCILRQAYSPQDSPKLTQISLKRWMVTCDHQPDEVILCSRQSASVSFLAPFPTILKLI